MASATDKGKPTDRPYSPSWVDRFNAWVAALPVGAGTFYGGLGGVLVLVQILVWVATLGLLGRM